MLMREAAKHGVSAWVEGTVKRTSAVDVDDVAASILQLPRVRQRARAISAREKAI
jgi:hypothetical protein